MEPEIENFVSNLVSHLRSENVFSSIEKEVGRSRKYWDTVAKQTVGEVVKKIFQKNFPEEDQATAVYVEKKGVSFELFLGKSKFRKKPYELFGGIGIYPDIAILKPKKILIELDNSGSPKQGRGGARLKVALAKAAFGYLTGEWDYCIVFFHNRCKESIEPYLKREIEDAILQKYATDFHTKVFVFQ